MRRCVRATNSINFSFSSSFCPCPYYRALEVLVQGSLARVLVKSQVFAEVSVGDVSFYIKVPNVKSSSLSFCQILGFLREFIYFRYKISLLPACDLRDARRSCATYYVGRVHFY